MTPIFTTEKLCHFLHYWFLLAGFLSTLYGGDVVYKEFWLKKKAILIGDVEELPEDDGYAFQSTKKRK